MKTTRFLVAALGLLAGMAASAFAQTHPMAQPAAQAVRPQIAVIDIGRVFKEHPRFIDEMARLKTRVEAEDAKMKARADRLQTMAEELKSLEERSQGYKEKEKLIASERAQMQIDIQVQRKEFLQQEAAIYREIYQGVKAEVANYASQMGLAAVIRYASQPPEADPDQPNMVLAEIQKDVVWFAPQLDITNVILDSLKARSNPTSLTTRPGIPPYAPQNTTPGGYRR